MPSTPNIANACIYFSLQFAFSCDQLSGEIANNTLVLQQLVDLLTNEPSTTNANNTLLLQHIVDLLTNEASTTHEPSTTHGPITSGTTDAPAAVGGVNYKRWGRTVCQENATLVYAGTVCVLIRRLTIFLYVRTEGG